MKEEKNKWIRGCVCVMIIVQISNACYMYTCWCMCVHCTIVGIRFQLKVKGCACIHTYSKQHANFV